MIKAMLARNRAIVSIRFCLNHTRLSPTNRVNGNIQAFSTQTTPIQPIKKLLIANRGEIAVRIARAAAELNIQTVGVYATDDAQSLHTRMVDEYIALNGVGPRPYLDIEQIIQAALSTGCDSIHPGYGFLSENAHFAKHCRANDLNFVGPTTDQLQLFGDKFQALALAEACGVPTLRYSGEIASSDEAVVFFNDLRTNADNSRVRAKGAAGMMIKARAGGGGKGMRVVSSADEV